MFYVNMTTRLEKLLESNGYVLGSGGHIHLKQPPEEFPTSFGKTWGQVKDKLRDYHLPLAFYHEGGAIEPLHSDKPKVAEHHPRLEGLLIQYLNENSLTKTQ